MRVLWRSLLLIILLLAAALVLIATTETGLRFAWGRIQPLLPVDVQLESLHGSLTSTLALRGIVLQDEAFHLNISEVELEWSPRQLWRRVVHIRELRVAGLDYTQLAVAQPEPQEPFSLPPQIKVPLEVRLDRLDVQDVHYRGAGDAQALEITELESRVHLTRSKLDIGKLQIAAPLFNLFASAAIGTGDNYPLTVDARWTLRPGDYPELAGHTRASGSLQQLTLDQMLGAPYSMQAQIVLDEPLGELRYTGEVRLDEFALQTLRADGPPVILAGRLAAQGSISGTELNADLTVNETGTIEVQGHYTRDAIDAVLEWSAIEWPYQTGLAHSDAGKLQITGDLDDYRLTLQGALDMPQLTRAQVQLSGQGDRQSLRVEALQLDVLEGRIEGTAQASWDPQPGGSVDLRGSRLNPGGLLEGWNGRLDMALQADGQIAAEGVAVQVKVLNAAGSLRDYPVQLEARAGYAGEKLELDSLRLSSGPSRVTAAGHIGERLDLTWEIRSSDLASLLPGAGGRLSGAGRAKGSLRTPQVSANLEGGDLEYANHRLQSLVVDAALDLTGAQRSSIEVRLDGGLVGETRIDSVTLQVKGTPESHRLELNAESGQGAAGLAASGSLKEDHWAFELTRGSLRQPPLAAWTLAAPARGEVGKQRAALQESCWQSAGATLCAGADWRPGQGQASIRLEQLPLAWVEPFVTSDLSFEGTLDGRGEFILQDGQAPVASVHLQSSAGRLLSVVPAADSGQAEEQELINILGFEPGEVHLDMDQAGMDLSALLPLAEQGGIELHASVGQGDAELIQRPLRGRLQTDLRDLGFLTAFVPQLSRVSGRLEGDTALSGTLQRPVVKGELALVDGGAALDDLGLELSAISMALSGSADERIQIRLAAVSGGGTLKIEGDAAFADNGPGARFDVRGENFKVLGLPEAEVFVSPALTLQMQGRDIDLQGEILVPEAEIKPKKLPASAQTVSGDQVLVDQADTAAVADAYRITSNVRLILADKVKFDGFGLTGRFTGNLLTRSEPQKQTTATGEIRVIDGKYKAYGQNLDIRTGRLLFVGASVAEPGIDLEAVRNPAPDVLVGVRARGQLRQPDISVFSEPDMSQSDQIAWLVLGRPLESDSTTEERNSVNQAALALGLGGGALLGKEVGEKIGVDEVSIESGPGEATEQAALLVGKYLTPKLFISYGIGLFEPVSTLRLRYTLSSKWKLLGEASATGSSADIFYVIERGR